MALFTIDPDKCKGDGICAAECPLRIITIDGEGVYPTLAEGSGSLCNNCGHCVAVCPQGALSLNSMKPEECKPVERDLFPGFNQLKELICSRRSIRTYADKAVDRETLSCLIDVARYAPTARNQQLVNWTVIEGKAGVKHLAGLVLEWMRLKVEEEPAKDTYLRYQKIIASWEKGDDRILRGAPHIVVAHALKTATLTMTDCIIALTCFDLAAFSKGLGTCWAGYLMEAANTYPPVFDALALPGDHQCYGAIMIGYPKYHYNRIPLRNSPAVFWR